MKTPYLLLLSHPGINVISASELAGETGPIEFYAHAKAITGRAGLFPSRYQSDETDKAGGLARFRNSRMRAAWMLVADNLIKCNAWYHGKYELWKQQGVDPRDIRCRIANRVTRTVFQMVHGRRLFDHPSRLDRQYVLDKLMQFHQDRQSPPDVILRDLNTARDQIPEEAWLDEAAPLKERYDRACRSRRASAVPISELLLVVLARYGITGLELESEAQGTSESESVTSPK